jgi:flavodoxin
MKIEVRYLSKSGNTEKVARAVAEAAGTAAESIRVPVPADTEFLFIGGATYAFGIDDEIKQYIHNLPQSIKHAAVFGTSAIVKSVLTQITQALTERGIPVSDKTFYCRGEFKFMHKGRPNADDLKNAEEFAKAVITDGI